MSLALAKHGIPNAISPDLFHEPSESDSKQSSPSASNASDESYSSSITDNNEVTPPLSSNDAHSEKDDPDPEGLVENKMKFRRLLTDEEKQTKRKEINKKYQEQLKASKQLSTIKNLSFCITGDFFGVRHWLQVFLQYYGYTYHHRIKKSTHYLFVG